MLKKTQLNYVREQLMNSLEKSTDSGTTVPQFQESGLHHGRFHLSCANEPSYQWLKTAVADISVSSEEDETVSLRLPKYVKCFMQRCSFRDHPWTAETYKTATRTECWLSLDRWLLRHPQSTDQSMFMVCSIDKGSADVLEAIADRPDFGLGRITFRVAWGPGPSEAAGQ